MHLLLICCTLEYLRTLGFETAWRTLLFLGTTHFLFVLGLSQCLLDLFLQLQPFKETAEYLAKNHPCSELPFIFLVALRIAENTKLLCHDAITYASSSRFPWALQSVRGGEGEFLFPSSLVLSSE